MATGGRRFWSFLAKPEVAEAEPVRPETAFQTLFGTAAAEPGAQFVFSPEDQPPPPEPAPAEARPHAPAEVAAAPSKHRVRAEFFLAPQDLLRTPLGTINALAMGSCFLGDLLNSAPDWLKSDFMIPGDISRIPKAPPNDIAGYDFADRAVGAAWRGARFRVSRSGVS